MENKQELDWSSLGFGYHPTHYNVRCYWRDGAWGELEVSDSEMITIPMAATSLHYGQEAFEGLKAFRVRDVKLPTERFLEAIDRVLELNKDFIPPYESGASLYIRPLLIGLGKQVGIAPANEYLFLVFVTPVGAYFKTGFRPSPMAIMRGYDRAAPLGTGTYKVGGNYAASLKSGVLAHELGYSAVIYLDAKEKLYIDECGPANFFGIRENTYITPKSSSILPSVTNKSLMQLAQDMGLKVEQRPVHVEELATFEEAGACGTAAVISPILRVDYLDEHKQYVISKDGNPGPISTALYERLRAIQYGDYPDEHGWVRLYESL